jgi:hypothetical protein
MTLQYPVLTAASILGVLLPVTLCAQGVGVPPLYDHGSPALVTIQFENSLTLSDQPYGGTTAFRLRLDWDRVAFGGAIGVAFLDQRSLLLALTPQFKVFNTCEPCIKRLVGGVVLDATRVRTGLHGTELTAAIGPGVSWQVDQVGYGIDISAGIRGGLRHSSDETDGFWGASIGAAVGIPLSFQLFGNVDYVSPAPRRAGTLPDGGAWSLAAGMRVRAGPGA